MSSRLWEVQQAALGFPYSKLLPIEICTERTLLLESPSGVDELTQFEFVQVTIAIILGLGLTDILRNLGEQFRNRSEIEVSWLQVGASCMLLLVILIYNLWGFWGALEVNWTLQLFMLQVSPAIALALSAQLIKVDISSGKTPEAQYFNNCTATFTLWATAPLFSMFFSLATTGNVNIAADAARIGVAILLVSLGLIKNRIYHTVVLSVLLLSATSVVFFEFQ